MATILGATAFTNVDYFSALLPSSEYLILYTNLVELCSLRLLVKLADFGGLIVPNDQQTRANHCCAAQHPLSLSATLRPHRRRLEPFDHRSLWTTGSLGINFHPPRDTQRLQQAPTMAPPSLGALCRKTVVANIDELTYVSYLPYERVRSLLSHVRDGKQLQGIEEMSPQIQAYSDELWEAFTKKKFPVQLKKRRKLNNDLPLDIISWRDLYWELRKEDGEILQ